MLAFYAFYCRMEPVRYFRLIIFVFDWSVQLDDISSDHVDGPSTFQHPVICPFFFGLVIFVCRFWVIRPFYGSVIPSTLWTCKFVPHFGWSVHFVAAIPSTLWTYKIIPVLGDPSTLWRLYRPLYGLVRLFTVLGDPSTLWRLYRPLYGLVRLFPVLGDPSTLRTCSFTVMGIRPSCGLYFVSVHLVDFKLSSL